MGNRLPPVVGNWYAHRDKGALFQVVALDEYAVTVEIHEFDGGLDELDFDEWQALSVDSAAQPEDWSGSEDDVEPDEFGYTDLSAEDGASSPVEDAITTWEQIVEDDDFDEPIH